MICQHPYIAIIVTFYIGLIAGILLIAICKAGKHDFGKRISKCCDASVTVEGTTTLFHVCSQCKKPCDVFVR